MNSIFAESDKEANVSTFFWLDYDICLHSELIANPLLCSNLKIKRKGLLLRLKTFILTSTHIFYCKLGQDVPKYQAMINWKILDAFTEDNDEGRKYGFRLGHKDLFQDFYAEDERDLETWLNYLCNVTILSQIENHYVTIKQIGSGNFSKIYLAEEREKGLKFALKKIKSKTIQRSSIGVKAVVNEIIALKALNHSNVVKLHRIFEDLTGVYLVLELVEGGDLIKRIRLKQRIAENIAAKFMTRLLKTIRYMHNTGIVHRDIKPENILMVSHNNDYEFKICDFGLSFSSTEDQEICCGSPGYVAPEILQFKSYNHKIDLFGAGVILFIIISGQSPFGGSNSSEILVNNKKCRLRFDKEHWAKISRSAKQIVLSLCDPNPENRISVEQALNHQWFLEHRKDEQDLSPVTESGESKTLIIKSNFS